MQNSTDENGHYCVRLLQIPTRTRNRICALDSKLKAVFKIHLAVVWQWSNYSIETGEYLGRYANISQLQSMQSPRAESMLDIKKTQQEP